jgi:TolB-like protein
MTAGTPEESVAARPTVFLSYASEDRRAAQLLRDTLPDFGLEVWYDESDLVGGDAWDQKIRGQIRACDYFMPVISAHTEARHEGYFRREWRLAVERTLDMADDHVFLLPVVIDGTVEAGARVPEKFRAVQWLRLPDGRPSAALEALCRRLVSGDLAPRPALERTPTARGAGTSPPAGGSAAVPLPAFPREEPGQRVRFFFQVAGWGLRSAWAGFKRLPRWLRIVIYIWLAVVLISRCGTSDSHRSPHISANQAQRLRDIAASHPGGWTAADTTRLIAQIAKEVPAEAGGAAAAHDPVLAIPFAAPTGDAAAQKLAGSVFTQLYGRLSIARHGRVALADAPLPALDTAAAVAQGRARHATYVVSGAVGDGAAAQWLTVDIISVADGSTSWSKSYPLAGADPAAIAAEVSAKVPLRGGG